MLMGVTTHKDVAGVEAEGEGTELEAEGTDLEGEGMAGVGGVGEWGGVGGREEGTIGTDDDGGSASHPGMQAFVCTETCFDFTHLQMWYFDSSITGPW